ncbi:MAG: HD domain-containing protein [Deltaproteobacteria bacterium]|nr:HD domain-containing protein [Deltaproteobacteria bacterium]
MTSPQTAARILGHYGKGALWAMHSRAVADAALLLGQTLPPCQKVDMGSLCSMALLHDIGRCVTHDPVLHGVEGYRLLTALGHADCAFICASHVLFGLDAAEAVRFGLPEQDFLPVSMEQRLVSLADLLIEGVRPTTLERRFSSLRIRNEGNDWFLARLDKAYDKALAFRHWLEKKTTRSVAGFFPLF